MSMPKLALAHLKRLREVHSVAGIKPLSAAAFPGNHCPMHTALTVASNIRGLSTLVIGSAECAYYSQGIVQGSPFEGQAFHWSYILDDKDIVFGCREKVAKAIKGMDEAGARVILLIGTCLPEVVGEDLPSLIFELQPKVKATLVSVDLGNFKCVGYQPGFWKTIRALGSLVKAPVHDSRTVNVLGRSPKEDHHPMPYFLETLQQAGIPLRLFASDSSIEDLEALGDAKLNLVVSPFVEPLAQWLFEKHGTPYYVLHSIYASKDILNLYESILAELGLNLFLAGEFEAMREKSEELERAISHSLSDASFITANIGAVQALPMINYISALGLCPLLVHLEDFYPSDRYWSDQILATGVNPLVCVMMNNGEDAQYIKALAPDLVLGEWAGSHGVAEGIVNVPYIFDLFGQVGFERTISLLTRILEVR